MEKGKTIITTIVIGVIVALLSGIFSPVFSPLNEIIKDGLLGEPNTNIISAMTFDYDNKKVSKPVYFDDIISTRSITFNFNSSKSSVITPLGNFLSLLDIKNYIPNFECSIDGKPFEECMSPKPYANLDTEVDHLFQVRAKSILGNTDKSPANFTFTTITSASVHGQIKENATVYDNSEITLDTDKNYFNTTTTDDKGRFLFEEVGKGLHTIDVFYKENNQTQYDYFFVPAAIETINIDLNIQNMSPRVQQNKDIDQNQNISNPIYIPSTMEQISQMARFQDHDIPTSTLSNVTEDLSQQIQQKAEQLGMDEDISQQIGQASEQIAEGEDIKQAIEQKALQLGIDEDISQQIGQAIKLENIPIDLAQESTLTQKDPNIYFTKISINADVNILSNIQHVEYYLHPTFDPNKVTSFIKENRFSITFTNWGIFNLKAKVYFNNGTIHDLELPIEKWKLPL